MDQSSETKKKETEARKVNERKLQTRLEGANDTQKRELPGAGGRDRPPLIDPQKDAELRRTVATVNERGRKRAEQQKAERKDVPGDVKDSKDKPKKPPIDPGTDQKLKDKLEEMRKRDEQRDKKKGA
jgi:hypothetical protein